MSRNEMKEYCKGGLKGRKLNAAIKGWSLAEKAFQNGESNGEKRFSVGGASFHVQWETQDDMQCLTVVE